MDHVMNEDGNDITCGCEVEDVLVEDNGDAFDVGNRTTALRVCCARHIRVETGTMEIDRVF
jgi:hypothetical protein